MLRKTYRVQSVRSVRTLPAHLYHRRDFERRKRAMRYIKEEYDYISSIRRSNILFDMALYKLASSTLLSTKIYRTGGFCDWR